MDGGEGEDAGDELLDPGRWEVGRHEEKTGEDAGDEAPGTSGTAIQAAAVAGKMGGRCDKG